MNWLDLVVKGKRLCDSSSSLVFVWILLFLDSTLAWILEYIFNDIYAFTNVCMSENWERQTVYFKNWNTYTWCKVKSKYLKTMEYLLWLIKKSFRIYERVTSASKHQCCEGEVISVFWLLAHTQGGHSLWPAVYLQHYMWCHMKDEGETSDGECACGGGNDEGRAVEEDDEKKTRNRTKWGFREERKNQSKMKKRACAHLARRQCVVQTDWNRSSHYSLCDWLTDWVLLTDFIFW